MTSDGLVVLTQKRRTINGGRKRDAAFLQKLYPSLAKNVAVMCAKCIPQLTSGNVISNLVKVWFSLKSISRNSKGKNPNI